MQVCTTLLPLAPVVQLAREGNVQPFKAGAGFTMYLLIVVTACLQHAQNCILGDSMSGVEDYDSGPPQTYVLLLIARSTSATQVVPTGTSRRNASFQLQSPLMSWALDRQSVSQRS